MLRRRPWAVYSCAVATAVAALAANDSSSSSSSRVNSGAVDLAVERVEHADRVTAEHQRDDEASPAHRLLAQREPQLRVDVRQPKRTLAQDDPAPDRALQRHPRTQQAGPELARSRD